MKRILGALILIVSGATALFAQTGEIVGIVTDENGEGVPFANVAAKQGGQLVTGTTTDFNGQYTIKPLDPGKYDVEITYIGYAKSIRTGVQVNSDKQTELDVQLKSEEQVLGVVDVVKYKVPLIDKENNSTKQTISKEEIMTLPTRDINSIASTSAGVYSEDEGSGLNIKGARTSGTEYYIDGIRVRGSTNLPANAIEQLTVITGGVPAKYGDATGGVVNITTRGPSRSYSGGVELITSQFMDAMEYNLINFNLTGPLWKKNKGEDNEKAVAGFFVAGEYLRQRDPDPPAKGVNVAKDDVLDFLEANPLTPAENSDAFIVTAETITEEDLEKQEFKPNTVRNQYSLAGKFDFRVSDNINLTVGGNVNYAQYHSWIERYTLLNSVNNPLQTDMTWRVYGRLTQKFGRQSTGEDEEGSRSPFQNAFYSLQFDYTKVKNQTEDDTHGLNEWDYGYVGSFETFRAPVYGFGTDDTSGLTGWQLQAFQDTLVSFVPGDKNENATNFTEQYYELAGEDPDGFYETLNQISANNGLLNGDRPRIPHGIWYNTGRQYGGYDYQDDDQFRLTLNGSVDILPPGADSRNKHAIEFGFEFEQRIDRSYNLSAIGLWSQARLLTNRHLQQLDLNNPTLFIDGQQWAWNDPNRPDFTVNDTISYNRLYEADQQSNFDQELRQALGYDIDDTRLIDVDALSPEQMDLAYFSAGELLNNGNAFVAYNGYDYLGNKLNSQPSFEDFFTATDENGELTRPVGAFRPIYSAVYLQDKFNFRDLLFNIGVRIDRYDANQKVLKDQFSLYDAYTVAEAETRLAPGSVIPDNMGDDYVVYVDNPVEGSANPLGFRSGDTWFNANGEEINDPSIIAQSTNTGQITPFLKDPNININPDKNESGDEFDPNSSFEDYEPQITVMPRVAFSFNLTDEASFFAHYDVLAQRPNQNLSFATPVQWLFFEENVGGVIANPNLKPEKTIDYQLGFRQLVSRNSAITISAFYRELRDMVQVINVPFAYPRDYLTYGNVDFGTVKGLSVAFDLRKTATSNFSMRLNYTLQFAEGTGSNSTSQLNLVAAGQPNLRTIAPLSFDSRHVINATLDYTFGTGSDYNGPKWGGKNVFSGAGINLIARARSGEPYTQQRNATPTALFTVPQRPILEGGINGSRLPWNFRLDLRIFKNFNVKLKERADGSQRRPLNFNVYFLFQNILNTRNVVNVYPFTGNPDDDGYLDSPEGEQNVASQNNSQSFADLYRAYVDRPNNYSRPRQIRLGVQFNF